MVETLFDYGGAAQHLNTTARHVRLLVYRRELAHVKVGRLVRFRKEDLDAYIESRRVKPVRA